MKEIVICVEVNNYWLKEQQEKGQIPFSQVKDMLLKQYPNLDIVMTGNRLEIKNVESSQNSILRELIKKFFSEKYQMSISEGDYNLTARIYSSTESTKEDDRKSKEETEELKEDDGFPPDETPTIEIENNDNRYIQILELEKFLSEYDVIIKNAKKYKITDIVWSTNILLSIDAGNGISTVNDRITEVLYRNGFVFNSKTQKAVVEYSIPDDINVTDKYWNAMLNEIEHYYSEEKSNGRRNNNAPIIFCIDLSECLGSINERKFHENLYKLAKIKGSFIYVFRIPFVESVALNNMKGVLSDILLIRQIVVPPFSNTVLVSYLKRQLGQGNISFHENVDDLLEKLIAIEKQDGHFNGLKTMDRLATDIIYNKLSMLTNEEKLVLSRQELLDTYTAIKNDEISPEETLTHLYGMENVKQTIDEIIAQIQLYKELKESGKKLSAPTMHMRFVGNPGTGKTTVARLVAQIFKEKGILNKGYFYEIKARDLCGRYVGETAPKTSGYCKDALGSVLFIDEAYSLYHGKGSADYGQEAIETLISEMENNRDNLVVIMAGYKNEMDDLLKSNPGLASRMPYEINFRNYTKGELIDIFYSMLGDNFSYTDGFDQNVREFINSIPDSILKEEEFSNARMVRNLYERIWSKAAYRRSVSNEEEIILQEDDVQRAITDEEFHQLLVNKKSKIGF